MVKVEAIAVAAKKRRRLRRSDGMEAGFALDWFILSRE
jgi:hypothetical protein